MVHHLERGSCPGAPQLNRDQIYKLVRSRDPNGIISKKLIGWTGEADVTYEANGGSWNGYGYECYLCPKQCSSLSGLNQHLNSAVRKYTANMRWKTYADLARVSWQTSRSSTTARTLLAAQTSRPWLLSSTISRASHAGPCALTECSNGSATSSEAAERSPLPDPYRQIISGFSSAGPALFRAYFRNFWRTHRAYMPSTTVGVRISPAF